MGGEQQAVAVGGAPIAHKGIAGGAGAGLDIAGEIPAFTHQRCMRQAAGGALSGNTGGFCGRLGPQAVINGERRHPAGKGRSGQRQQRQAVRPARSRHGNAFISGHRAAQRRRNQCGQIRPHVWPAHAVHLAFVRWRPASAFCVSVNLAP